MANRNGIRDQVSKHAVRKLVAKLAKASAAPTVAQIRRSLTR